MKLAPNMIHFKGLFITFFALTFAYGTFAGDIPPSRPGLYSPIDDLYSYYRSFVPEHQGSTHHANVSPDEIKRRFNTLTSEIRFEYYEEVGDFIHYYLERQHENFEIALGLYQQYREKIAPGFSEYLLPQELTLLPFALSGMHNHVTTSSGGTGIWTLNYYVAKSRGLVINDYIDERKDILKATQASADYLITLFNKYQSWNLAITAFASSPAIVNKAIMRSGNKLNYWQVRPFLPEEVQQVVPSFFAAVYLYRFHAEHGMVPAGIDLDIPKKPVYPENDLSVELLSGKLNISEDVLRILNPTLRGPMIPAKDKVPAFFLPEEHIGTFDTMQANLYEETKEFITPKKVVPVYTYKAPVIPEGAEEVVYVVRSGDFLGRIASRYNVSVTNLKQWNGLSSDRIDIGQKITVYLSEAKKKAFEASPAPVVKKPVTGPATVTASRTSSGSSYVQYTVKEGDTLWNIAKNNPGNSVEDIQKQNNISASIKPGQVIIIKGR